MNIFIGKKELGIALFMTVGYLGIQMRNPISSMMYRHDHSKYIMQIKEKEDRVRSTYIERIK